MAAPEYAAIGYLGPAGTNTHEALASQHDLSEADAVAYATIGDVVDAVEAREIEAGLIPIENSVEGAVNIAVDRLAFEPSDLLIRREVVRRVDMALIGLPGTDLSTVREVTSHPHANAQCREHLRRLLPDAIVTAANSTAEAARRVAEERDSHVVAIGTTLAATSFGLDVLVPDVADFADAETRFVLLGRGVPPRTGADKTSIVCFLAKDSPGSLLAILQEFTVRGLNLTKLESRPMKGRLGEYFFVIDFEGHLADALVVDALRGLRYRFSDVRFLGSYPRAKRYGQFHEEEEEAQWAEAGRWIEGLRGLVEDDRAPG